MSTWSDAQIQLAREIVAISTRWNAIGRGVPPLLHLAVVLQESGMLVDNPGDAGQSFGPHQIYQVAHPHTEEVAVSPWADYGFFIMAQEWVRAYGETGGDAAWSDPANRPAFIEAFAPNAQGSIRWQPGLGARHYGEALELLELVS